MAQLYGRVVTISARLFQPLFSGSGSGADFEDLDVDFLDLLNRARKTEAAKESDSEQSGLSSEEDSSSS